MYFYYFIFCLDWNFLLKKFWAKKLLRKKYLNESECMSDFQQFKSESIKLAIGEKASDKHLVIKK